MKSKKTKKKSTHVQFSFTDSLPGVSHYLVLTLPKPGTTSARALPALEKNGILFDVNKKFRSNEICVLLTIDRGGSRDVSFNVMLT